MGLTSVILGTGRAEDALDPGRQLVGTVCNERSDPVVECLLRFVLSRSNLLIHPHIREHALTYGQIRRLLPAVIVDLA